MHLREKISKSLALAVNSLTESEKKETITLEFPEGEVHGDFTTNIALTLSRELKKSPKELATEIVTLLKNDNSLKEEITKIEIAGPGFINFFLSEKPLVAELARISKDGDEYGKQAGRSKQKYMVEFAHPNTHKSFHIGHLRNIITGEAISRILEASGVKVIRVNYQGDVGLHIAKAIWGIKKIGFYDPTGVRERAEYLAKAYVAGSQAYEEDEEAKKGIEELNKRLYEAKDAELVELYQKTRKWSLNYFDTIYKRVYTKFDRLYFESEVFESGRERALKALEKGILIKSEGAIIYPGEVKGLHNRVFINSHGLPTYEAKDLGLADLQFSEYLPDKVVHIVGPEQKGYFEVVFRALEDIDPKIKGKELHLPYGWVSLKGGKMSSRKGNVVLGEWLLDEVKRKIVEKYGSEEAVAEKVAVAATKYSFLKVNISQDIAFDIDESVSIEGNSGPYLQYTYARSQSVLAKAKETKEINKNNQPALVPEEVSVLRSLIRFPEVISMSVRNYSPNLICNYLFDLAQKYNNFYNQQRIIGSENENFRLSLTKATGQVIKNGLNLLGIEAPERM